MDFCLYLLGWRLGDYWFPGKLRCCGMLISCCLVSPVDLSVVVIIGDVFWFGLILFVWFVFCWMLCLMDLVA